MKMQYQDKQVEEFTDLLELHPKDRIFKIKSQDGVTQELWFCGSVAHSKNFFDYGWVCEFKHERIPSGFLDM